LLNTLFSVLIEMPKGQSLSVLCDLQQSLAGMPSSRLGSGMGEPLLYTHLIDPNRVQEGRSLPSSEAADFYNTW